MFPGVTPVENTPIGPNRILLARAAGTLWRDANDAHPMQVANV